jgi:hypothetical protein
MNAWTYLDNHPPAVVRLMARRRMRGKTVKAVSIQEVAIAANLPLERAQKIARLLSWDNVTLSEARSFCTGCGFDPFSAADRNRKSAYLRSCKTFGYLRRSPFWESEFQPLIESIKARKQQPVPVAS